MDKHNLFGKNWYRFVKGNPASQGCWTCMTVTSQYLGKGNPVHMMYMYFEITSH